MLFPQPTHTVKRLSRETERGLRNSSCRLASHWRGAKGLGACRRGRHGRVPPETCQPRHQIQGQWCQAGEATNRRPDRGGAPSHRLAGPQAAYPYMPLATHSLLCGVSPNPRETAEETGGRNHFLTLRRGRLTFRENQFARSNVTERHTEGFCLQVQNSSGGNIPAKWACLGEASLQPRNQQGWREERLTSPSTCYRQAPQDPTASLPGSPPGLTLLLFYERRIKTFSPWFSWSSQSLP